MTHSLIGLVVPKALYIATVSIQKSNQSVYTSIEANLSSLYNLAHVKSCEDHLYSCSYISVGGTTYLIKLLSERLKACHQCHLTCEQHLNSTLFSHVSMLFWHEAKVNLGITRHWSSSCLLLHFSLVDMCWQTQTDAYYWRQGIHQVLHLFLSQHIQSCILALAWQVRSWKSSYSKVYQLWEKAKVKTKSVNPNSSILPLSDCSLLCSHCFCLLYNYDTAEPSCIVTWKIVDTTCFMDGIDEHYHWCLNQNFLGASLFGWHLWFWRMSRSCHWRMNDDVCG